MQNKTFSTLFIGQNLLQLSAVDSTNNYLKLMVSKSEPVAEGTVIMADDQFAGRGQLGSTWTSKAGLNLTFSIYLRPIFLSVNHQFDLNVAVSVGVYNALKNYVSEGISVKWPNDIYYQDRKIGGILIENTIYGSLLKSSIVGIGINVNQIEFDDTLRDKASSLKEILRTDVDLINLLEKICHCIEVQYLNLKSGKILPMRSQYLENLYRVLKPSSFKAGKKVFNGLIIGLSEEGRLIVENDGYQHTYGFKEIEFLDRN